MLEQSKVDEMNEALADYIIKRVEVLSPLTTPEELDSIGRLARVVNDAPKTVRLIEESMKPYKYKQHKNKRRG
ncbi:hypothetical protein U1P98_23230 [Lysinibacillus irui]|uniref:Uncharacterized protein n=1 Tax=Lysinibacillus irui TaxID=2998077 RepID=A0ABU5NT27_9BACI|nr:hypothetical protein [Lysinibacillus irui]MEA0556470.1 hypothetical protein [Lysinibacillus irui]MEA0979197.1 hypothetical protein [Lysinibacillus irui]MEA1045351.1 hypothetical protein [Lysinibacillus irui]